MENIIGETAEKMAVEKGYQECAKDMCCYTWLRNRKSRNKDQIKK